VITVTGTGFDDSSVGGMLECNNAPGQPTVSVEGQNIPVSCTNPLSEIVSTSSTGTVPATQFTIATGTTGPPCGSSCPGSDTPADLPANQSTNVKLAADVASDPAGVPATDAASYPCPPTAAQVAAGDSCEIVYGDLAGKQAAVDISFVPAPTVSPPASSSSSSSGGSSSTGTGTAGSSSAGTSPLLVVVPFLVGHARLHRCRPGSLGARHRGLHPYRPGVRDPQHLLPTSRALRPGRPRRLPNVWWRRPHVTVVANRAHPQHRERCARLQ
jgi:hypothetical protein